MTSASERCPTRHRPAMRLGLSRLARCAISRLAVRPAALTGVLVAPRPAVAAAPAHAVSRLPASLAVRPTRRTMTAQASERILLFGPSPRLAAPSRAKEEGTTAPTAPAPRPRPPAGCRLLFPPPCRVPRLAVQLRSRHSRASWPLSGRPYSRSQGHGGRRKARRGRCPPQPRRRGPLRVPGSVAGRGRGLCGRRSLRRQRSGDESLYPGLRCGGGGVRGRVVKG